jgi:putative addiction module CopG family antidote
MNVIVPTALEEFAKLKVAAGEFSSVDQVICEGLRLLQLREKWKNDAREKLDVGWEEAQLGELVSPEKVRENLALRKQAWRRENG